MHVHASANDRGAPGADHIDWTGFRDAIRATGYDGPVVIESFTAENETIATAASVWRPLAASQDAIAVDGLGVSARIVRLNRRPASSPRRQRYGRAARASGHLFRV